MKKSSENDAREIGLELGINWKEVDINVFTMGLNVELEHGTRYPETNVTNNDIILIGKIAWAHLKEFPDYYTRLEKLEMEAEEYWKNRGKDA